MKSERIRETQWNSCRDGLCSALTSMSPEYTRLFPPCALLSLLSSCFTHSTAARVLRLPMRPCGASKRANVGFPLLGRCTQLRVSPTGSSWCQAGYGRPLVPPHNLFGDTWLAPVWSPAFWTTQIWCGDRRICSLLWQSLLWLNFTKKRQSCACTRVCACARLREGMFSVSTNSIHSCRIPLPILRKHSLKLEEAFVWKVMKFRSNRGRK